MITLTEFDSAEISLSSPGYYEFNIDIGDLGDHSFNVDPDEIISEGLIESDLDSVDVSFESIAEQVLGNELLDELMAALLVLFTEEALLDALITE